MKDASRDRRVRALQKQLEKGLLKEVPQTWVGKLLKKKLQNEKGGRK